MSKIPVTLQSVLEYALTKAEDAINCGRTVRPGLMKQLQALEAILKRGDYERAEALLMDGLQDEIDLLESQL